MRLTPVVAPRPHPRVVEAELFESRVLFHMGDRRLHILNGTASAVWEELETAQTVGDITIGIGDRFGVAPQEIRSDVEILLDQLRADGLLTVNGGVITQKETRPPSSVLVGPVAAPRTGSYRALSSRVGISSDDPEIVAYLDGVLAPLHCGEQPDLEIRIVQESETVWSVAVADSEAIEVGSRLAAVLRVIGEINNVAVASSPKHLLLHAGAVANANGVVLLPAGSNHGKSTLTTALVQAGCGYLTDEAAAIGPGLMVKPFPKSIALDPGSFPLFPELAPDDRGDGLRRALNSREWHIDPFTVGRVGEPAPVKVVIAPSWRAGTAIRLHRSDPAEALHELIGDAFDFEAGGQPVFERLVELVRTVPVYRLGYSDLSEAVAVVDALLQAPELAPC